MRRQSCRSDHAAAPLLPLALLSVALLAGAPASAASQERRSAADSTGQGQSSPADSAPQERPPRAIPPLRIPRSPPSTPPGTPATARDPILGFTLSEGTPASDAAPEPEPPTRLSSERTADLLARLPARGGPSTEPSGPPSGEPSSTGPTATPSRAPGRVPTSDHLRVLSVSPAGEVELVPYVTVVFSEPMVALGADGEPIAGTPPARLEPEVAGAWRWLDVRTLRFEPDEGRLPGATEFTVEVPESTRSVDGTALAAVHRVGFRTAGPRALGGFPNRDLGFREGLADLLPTILLVFDQAVDGASVLDAAELVADSASRPMRLVGLEEMDDDLVAAARDAGDDMWVGLRPVEPLPPGAHAVLTVSADLTSMEGPLEAGRVQELRFRVRDALRVSGSDCDDEVARCPPGSWWIHFTNPLDEEQPLTERVHVEPEVRDLRVGPAPRGMWLSGDFRPHTSYRVELSPDIEDRFGQRLGRRTDVQAHFGRPLPFVQIPGAPFLVLDPASNHHVELASRSLDSLHVELYDVEPEEWQAFRRSLLQANDERYRAWPPSDREPRARWTVVPSDDGRGYTRTTMDLSPWLGDGGHAVLVARGIREDPIALGTAMMWPWNRRAMVAAAWIQSTSFALGGVWNPEELVTWAIDAVDAEPAEGVLVRLSDESDGATTDRRGLARIDLSDEPSPVLLGVRDDEVAILPAMVARPPRDGWVGDPYYPSPLWLTVSDRGLYRPGEDVEAHGWIREMAGRPRRDLAFPHGIDEVSYRVTSPRNDVVGDGVLPVTDDGTFHLVVHVPDGARSGRYTITLVARVDGEDVSAWTSRTTFRVEEFRRPEYEVVAEADPGPHLPGEPFEVRTTARYYDGAALGGGTVDWDLSAFPASWYPAGWDGWTFGGGPRRQAWSSGEARASGRTDESGGHALRVEAGVPREPVPVQIDIEVQVRDVNRQAGSARAWTVLHPGARAPGLRLDRYWVSTAEEVGFDVVVLDLDGRVDAGRMPIVRVFLEPDPRRQEATEEEEDVPVECARGESETNAEQSFRPLRCALRPTVSGRYRVEAEVADDRGRRSLSRTWISAFGGDVLWRSVTDAMRLLPDRPSYEPGDTARVMVETPDHPMQGLLTVSRFGIREVRSVTLDAPRTEIDIPIHPEDVGTLWIQLETGSTNGGQPPRSATTRLRVDSEHRRLDVAAEPSRDTVAPGDEVDIEIRVADARGGPARGARTAVWLVDESVLALAGYALPDPHDHFYGTGGRDRLSFSLPQRLIRWARRPLGPGTVSAEVRSAATGALEGRIGAELEGTEHEAVVVGGSLVLRDVAPGTYRLVLTRDGAVVLERTVTVGEEGVDLGTLLVSDTRSRVLSLESVVVSGLSMTAERSAAGSVPAPPTPEPQDVVEVRGRFDALATFETEVVTDDDGRARVTVRLPDTMTRYRIFAVAAGGPRRFGKTESTVTAARDLVVRATPPRVLHPGDRPELPVVVQNASDEVAVVDVVARTRGLELRGTPGYRLRLPPGSHREVRFAATATRLGDGELEVLAAATPLADGPSALERPAPGRPVERTDAIRVPVPVSPPLAPRAAAVHDRVAAGSAVTLAVATPERAQPGFGGLEVEMSTTMLLPLVDVVRGLCLEPLLWPEATAARVLGLAGIDPALESLPAADLPDPEEIRARTRTDIARLEQWLRLDRRSGAPMGGFLSAVGVLNGIHALLVAEEAGYPIPGNWRRIGQDIVGRIWSASSVRTASGEGPPVRGYGVATPAYALHVASLLDEHGIARAGIGAEWVDWVTSLAPADLPVEVLGWLVGPVSDVPELSPVRDALLQELTNRALTTGATATMRQGGRAMVESEGIRRLALASDRRSDAVALLTLLEHAPDHPLVGRLARGLLGHRDGTREAGVHENAWVLLALGAYASAHESEATELTARVALDGEPLSDALTLDPETPTAVAEGPAPSPGARSSLRIDTRGTGSVYVRAGVRYAPLVTAETPAEERGFLVGRRYEAVDDSLDVRLDPDGRWRVRAGARVRVRVTFTALARRYQVQLEDPVPGGLEVVNPRLRGTGFANDPSLPPAASLPAGRVGAPLAGTLFNPPFGWELSGMYFRWRALHGHWATHEELRDDGMLAYTPLMLAGTYQTTYLVRATTPGTFLVPPPRVEETEHPESYGQGSADVVVVEERR